MQTSARRKAEPVSAAVKPLEMALSSDTRRLHDLLETARKQLVETGTRNKLVHTNRHGKRPSNLALFNPDIDRFFSRLLHEKASFRLRADPAATVREHQGTSNSALEIMGDTQEARVLSFDDQKGDALQTRLGANALGRKLLKFWRDAKTLEEEQGVNILYVAIGFLRWYEDDKSNVVRAAPLVLVPVSLERDRRLSSFTLRAREDDVSTNLPLAERLRDQEGIILPEIPEGDEWSTSDYFEEVSKVISAKGRWSVDRSGVELGFFSFAKLLMFRDLSREAWPGQSILKHPLICGLMQEGFPREEPLLSDDTNLDKRFAPADLMQIVDADGSQTLVIETVRAGRNIVVQGPPGTGKSQTITNIIAAAAYDGKKVLFIAEKMVALDVVYSKLKKAGLGPISLNLHSRSANKRSFVEDLKQALSSSVSEATIASQTAQLKNARDQLNQISANLHLHIGSTELSAHQALGDLVRAKGLKLPPPSFQIGVASQWNKEKYHQIRESAERYIELLKVAGSVTKHPWRGVRSYDLEPFDLVRLQQALPDIIDQLKQISKLCALTSSVVPTSAAPSLQSGERILEFLSLLRSMPQHLLGLVVQISNYGEAELVRLEALGKVGNEFMTRIVEDQKVYVPAAFDADTTGVRSRLVKGSKSILKRWGTGYRSASAELKSWITGPLPKSALERTVLVDRLTSIQKLQQQLTNEAAHNSALLGSFWRDYQTDFSGIERAVQWLRTVRQTSFNFRLDPALSLLAKGALAEQLQTKLQDLHDSVCEALANLSNQLS
jgi:hypothetical protein